MLAIIKIVASIRSVHMKKFFQIICHLFLLLSMSANADSSAEELIASTIKNQWETLNRFVEVPVIAVGRNYALADWMQGQRGGRALLRLSKGKWQTLMCGSAQLKTAQSLERAGVPSAEAKQISESLATKESNLSVEQLVLIDSFEGIVDVLTDSAHHHENH
jgi:hypothetical protein